MNSLNNFILYILFRTLKAFTELDIDKPNLWQGSNIQIPASTPPLKANFKLFLEWCCHYISLNVLNVIKMSFFQNFFIFWWIKKDNMDKVGEFGWTRELPKLVVCGLPKLVVSCPNTRYRHCCVCTGTVVMHSHELLAKSSDCLCLTFSSKLCNTPK